MRNNVPRANATFIREALKLQRLLATTARTMVEEQAKKFCTAGTALIDWIALEFPDSARHPGIREVWPTSLLLMEKSPNSLELELLVNNIQDLITECFASQPATG